MTIYQPRILLLLQYPQEGKILGQCEGLISFLSRGSWGTGSMAANPQVLAEFLSDIELPPDTSVSLRKFGAHHPFFRDEDPEPQPRSHSPSPRPFSHPSSSQKVGFFFPLSKHINTGAFFPPEQLFPAQKTHSRRFHMAPLLSPRQLQPPWVKPQRMTWVRLHASAGLKKEPQCS